MKPTLRAVPVVVVVVILGFAGCGKNVPPPLPVDQTYCDITAIPCQFNPIPLCCKPDLTCDLTSSCLEAGQTGACKTGNDCQHPTCKLIKCKGGLVDPKNITNVAQQCPTAADGSGPQPVLPSTTGGGGLCFDHNVESAATACQNQCNASLSKLLFPPEHYPFGTAGVLRAAPPNGGCSGLVDTTSNGHAMLPVSNYLANQCTSDPVSGMLFPVEGTDVVTLSGAGTAVLNGVGSSPVAVSGGHVRIAAPFTTCNASQATCPVQVNEVEIDFADFTLGGHSIDGLKLMSRAPALTASGILSAGFFTFKIPKGIPFDSVATVDGSFTGLAGTSSQEVEGSIDLSTGSLAFQFDVTGSFAGSTLEASGTATTDKVIALAPVVTAGAVTMTDLTTSCAASVTVSASAASAFGLPVTIDYVLGDKLIGSGTSATTTLAIGPSYEFDILGTDTNTMFDQIAETVTPVDSLGPIVTTITSPVTLWPPDHKYVTIALAQCVTSVVDQCDGSLDPMTQGQITSVTSNEQAAVIGSGNTCNDIVIASNNTVNLRAEREGGGQGRIYTINFTESDSHGNKTPATCVVQVPHDQSGAPATITTPVTCVGTSCGAIPPPHC